MSLLLVGVSHWTAPVSMLDRIATGAQSVTDLRDDIASSPFVAEVMIVSTCNRIEIVADVARFHGAVNDIAGRLAKHSGVPLDELTGHLYVHFEERAVHHLMSVSSGLDSMIVGEQQILGQVRRALSDAQEAGTAGRALNDLGQRSLRVGKKIHTETGIDRHGASVVTVALEETARILGTLVGRKALVVGAGAMSSLALKTLASQGVEDLVVASRTPESTSRAAALVGARTIPMAMVPAELKEVDIAVSATRASGLVITCDDVIEAMVGRDGHQLVVVDLALPHDTDPEINNVPGASRVALSDLADAPGAAAPAADLAAARAIVDEEVNLFLVEQAARRVEPIVVSLRAKADEVLEFELHRLRLKMPEMSDEAIRAVEKTMRRTVSTLLHTPTVRMKQFAADPEGQRYAEALHALFDLDPASVRSLSTLNADLRETAELRRGEVPALP